MTPLSKFCPLRRAKFDFKFHHCKPWTYFRFQDIRVIYEGMCDSKIWNHL